MGLRENLSIAYDCILENACGGSGADRIAGNEVGNQLLGGAGDDRLNSFGGNDILAGGSGNDVLRGGVGADAFVFLAGPVGSNGIDVILDFQPDADHLVLDHRLFGTDAGAVLAHLGTLGDGSAWLALSAIDGIAFEGVSAAALRAQPDSFVFV